MRNFIALINVLVLTHNQVQAQEIKPVAFYLANKHIPQIAKDIYTGKIKASDNTQTASVIDSLRAKHADNIPFYMAVCSQIMTTSSLEFVGIHARKFIESNPSAFLHFFSSPNPLNAPTYFDAWALSIAGELLIDCEDKENQCLAETVLKMKQNCPDSSRAYKEKLLEFEVKVNKHLP